MDPEANDNERTNEKIKATEMRFLRAVAGYRMTDHIHTEDTI
jgi:hypothetical protein